MKRVPYLFIIYEIARYTYLKELKFGYQSLDDLLVDQGLLPEGEFFRLVLRFEVKEDLLELASLYSYRLF